MFKIIESKKIAENTYLLKIDAPDIASHTKPGQFIIVIPPNNEGGITGERVPLTIADSDDKAITIIFVVAGKSTDDLSLLKKGDEIKDLVGPLGKPSVIHDEEPVCLIGGGVGIAAIYPIAKEYALQGKKVHCILGVRNKNFFFWDDKFREFCDKVIIASDDGSVGDKGNVVEVLDKYYAGGSSDNKEKYDYKLMIAIGPTIMMKFAVKYAKKKGIKSIVSLNTLMVDGIGMCGGCRINYGQGEDKKVKFVCVDGPEFDGALVDFDEILNRNASYKENEGHVCKLNDIALKKK